MGGRGILHDNNFLIKIESYFSIHEKKNLVLKSTLLTDNLQLTQVTLTH